MAQRDDREHPEAGSGARSPEERRKLEQRERYRELLEELRTIIPGVQVLFAFLLTVPFASRFEDLDLVGKSVFTVTLLLTALAAIIFLTPTAYHRLAPRRDRAARLELGERMAVVGMMLLAAAIVCGVWVVVRFIFDSGPVAFGVAGAALVTSLTLWVIVPLRKRARGGPGAPAEPELEADDGQQPDQDQQQSRS